MPQYKVTVTVTGRGPFPTDMLRYDNCWPSRAEDASAITATVDARPARWEIQVSTHVPNRASVSRAFTVARWRSFMCQVSEPVVTPL